MMQEWLGLFVKVTKPVLTTLVYTGINSWLEAFQEEIKERQKQQTKRVLDSLTVNGQIANQQQVAVKSRQTLPRSEIKKHPAQLWPLRLSPQQLLHNSSESYSNSLRIFLAPPKQKSPEFGHLNGETTDMEQRISQALREFLQKNYSLHAPSKATEFLSGSWNNRNFHGEASIKALFDVLRSLPTIILHTEIEGSDINFYLAYWHKLSRTYSYERIFKFNYQTFLQESLKARVLNWRAIRTQLLNLGKSTEDIQRLGGNCELNLPLIEEQETLQAAGINTDQLTFTYQFDRQDFDALCQFLSICHCLVAGWVADIHYLVNEDIPPHLSVWLPLLAEAISDSQAQQAIFRATVSLYQDLLTVLGNQSSQEIPELALKLTESLMHLPDSSLAIAQVKYSFDCWRQNHQFSFPEIDEDLESIYSSLKQRDWQYLAKLQSCLSALPEEEQIIPIKQLVNTLTQQSGMKKSVSRERYIGWQLHHSLTIVAEKVFSVTTHANGNQLISQQPNNTLKLWHFDAHKGQLFPSHELNGNLGKILAVTHCCQGKILASSDTTEQRSYIKIWDLSTGKLIKTLFGHKQPIHALGIKLGIRSFLASGSHKIKLWDLNTGESWLTLFGHKKKVSCLAISNDGQTLISGSQDKTIRIWDLQTGELCNTLKGHQCSVNTVVLSNDGQTLVSGSEDQTIKIWNIKKGKLICTLTGHSGGVQTVTLSEYHQQLVSGCKGGTINLWEIETGERGEICGAARLQTLIGHQRAIRALAFSYDGQVLSSSCDDGMLQLWKYS